MEYLSDITHVTSKTVFKKRLKKYVMEQNTYPSPNRTGFAKDLTISYHMSCISCMVLLYVFLALSNVLMTEDINRILLCLLLTLVFLLC